MNIRKTLSVISAAAVILSFAGCKSPDIAETSAAATTAPAAEEHGQADTAVPAAFPGSSETTVISGESYVVAYTVSQTTTSAAETTKALAETTTADSETPVMTFDTKKPFSMEDIAYEITCGADRITTEVDHITLRMSYIGDDPGMFLTTGEAYSLEKNDNGVWRPIGFAEGYFWHELAYEVSAHSTPSFGISLEDNVYTEPLTAGEYRVVKKISPVGESDDRTFYAYFEIEEGNDEPEYQIEEENGSITLMIDEIQPDKFICEMPFPLPVSYEVICNTSRYTDHFCVGDIVEVAYSVMYKLSDDVYRIMPTSVDPSDYELDPNVCYKPVVYLYPTEKTEVDVKLGFNGRLTVTNPEYRNGWKVTAYPDGTLICDGKEYPYLFWEGEKDFELDTSRGFCVSGEETESFLSEKLSYLGLSDSEKAEFIEFWLPYMKDNAYNIITFAGEDYTSNAKLDISPSPETVIRVFMTFSPSDSFVDIPEQTLEKASDRNGFTIVEWGGSVTLNPIASR